MADSEKESQFARDDFMDQKKTAADEDCRRFLNMRAMLLDIAYTLEKDEKMKFVCNIRRRILDARSESELRMVMDGLLVLTGFSLRNSM